MSDTLTTVIAIALAAVLMFIFPLMTISDRSDDVSQLAVKSATTNFVDKIRTTGKITNDEYSKFIQTIGATGNTYDTEITVQVKDSNLGKKASVVDTDKIGEGAYYTDYTSQIEEKLNDPNSNYTYPLKEGDIVSVSVKNSNQTISQQLKNFLYTVAGKDTYTIAAEHAGIVTANGTTN